MSALDSLQIASPCPVKFSDMKGDERKAFMSKCLSAKKATQQDKMKTCNADAGEKKGDRRGNRKKLHFFPPLSESTHPGLEESVSWPSPLVKDL